jgi:hypothetical protein
MRTRSGFIAMDMAVALALGAAAVAIGVAALDVQRRTRAGLERVDLRLAQEIETEATLARVLATLDPVLGAEAPTLAGDSAGVSFLSRPLTGREGSAAQATHIRLGRDGRPQVWRVALQPGDGLPAGPSGAADWTGPLAVSGLRYELAGGRLVASVSPGRGGEAQPTAGPVALHWQFADRPDEPPRRTAFAASPQPPETADRP